MTDEDDQSDVTSTMTGSKVLDVDEYPTATFEIGSIEKLDEETEDGHPLYAFTGELTLHGETNDIEFQPRRLNNRTAACDCRVTSKSSNQIMESNPIQHSSARSPSRTS